MIDLRALYYRNRPEELLKREVRALEDQVPQINEGLAMLKAEVTIHEKGLTKLSGRAAKLEAKMRDAEAEGRSDIALSYAETMEALAGEQHRIADELRLAREAFDVAQELKREFMNKKEQSIQRATRALQAKRRTEWSRKATQALSVFEDQHRDPALEQVARQLLEEAEESDAELKQLLRRLAKQLPL